MTKNVTINLRLSNFVHALASRREIFGLIAASFQAVLWTAVQLFPPQFSTFSTVLNLKTATPSVFSFALTTIFFFYKNSFPSMFWSKNKRRAGQLWAAHPPEETKHTTIWSFPLVADKLVGPNKSNGTLIILMDNKVLHFTVYTTFIGQ